MASRRGRGRVSILRNAMRDLLKQYREDGLDMADVERAFPEQDRATLNKLLWNMKVVGEARADRIEGRRQARWYHAEPGPDRYGYHMDLRRLRVAHASDQADPLRLFGAQLHGGRCASVWHYAQKFQEKRA